MKIIRVTSDGRYTHHGIAHTEHEGYAGTSDNRWPIKVAINYERNSYVAQGEPYKIEVNGEDKGTFIKE